MNDSSAGSACGLFAYFLATQKVCRISYEIAPKSTCNVLVGQEYTGSSHGSMSQFFGHRLQTL